MEKLEEILVYQTLDVAIMKSLEALFGYVLFGIKERNNQLVSFGVNTQGHIMYRNHLYFQKNAKYGANYTKDEITRLANLYLNTKNKQFREHHYVQKNNLPDLFPLSKMKPVDVVPIVNPDTDVIEYWRCSWTFLLRPSFDEGLVPIIGPSLELHIGNQKNVVGLAYKWRLLNLKKGAKRYSIHLNSSTNGNSLEGASDPQIIYLPDAQSQWISPYYLGMANENEILLPASEYSRKLIVQPSIKVVVATSNNQLAKGNK